MEPTTTATSTASTTNVVSKSQTRKSTTTSGRKMGSHRAKTMQSSSQQTACTQLSKVIKKTYVRFDDYLDLNEENMRRSCKRLMNRLYKEPTQTNQTPASTTAAATSSSSAVAAATITFEQPCTSAINDKENSTTPATGACNGRRGSGLTQSSAIVSAPTSTGGRSYLRSQFERRQQRQLAAMLKSSKAKQATDALVEAILSQQHSVVAKESEIATGKVSAGATSNNQLHAQAMFVARNPDNDDSKHDLVEIGHCNVDAMSLEAADAYRRQQMVQKHQYQQLQQDSVARSHELSKRRFFEQLERRKSAAVSATTTVNATRDTSQPEVNSSSMQDVSKLRVLGQTREPCTKDQKQESGYNNHNHRQVLTRADKNGSLKEEGDEDEDQTEEGCCRVRRLMSEESENLNSNTQTHAKLDETCGNNNQIAWTHNLSATTNETQALLTNGTSEKVGGNSDATASLRCGSTQARECISQDATGEISRNRFNEVHVASSHDHKNHHKLEGASGAVSKTVPQSQSIDKYVNGSNMKQQSNVLGEQLGARLITDSKSSTLTQSGAIGIDACNSNRLLPMASMSNGLCFDDDNRVSKLSSSDLNVTAGLTKATTMFATQSNESMFEIKVPAAGELPSGSDQMDGVCDGYISELVVKQVAEVDGPATRIETDQVSKNAVGMLEKEMISDDRSVNFSGLTWQHEKEHCSRNNNQRSPPTSNGRQSRVEAQRDGPTQVEAASMISEGNKMRKPIVAAMMIKPTMVAQAEDCINTSASKAAEEEKEEEKDDDENKSAVEVGSSNHKFRGINSDGQQETIGTATSEPRNHEQQVECDSGIGAFDMVAPAISNSGSGVGCDLCPSTANDNQNGEEEEEASRKKQLTTRALAPATATKVYDIASHGSGARPARELRSADEVATGRAIERTGSANRTTNGSDIRPETDIADITANMSEHQSAAKQRERQKQLVEGSKVNGPDKTSAVSGGAVPLSNGHQQQVSGQERQCYGCSDLDDAQRNTTKTHCASQLIPVPSTCSMSETKTTTRITHESAPRDVLLSPEAVVDGSREEYVSGGKINRLLVRNETDDVKSEQQHENRHDYELHDANPKVDKGSGGCKSAEEKEEEDTNGKEFREQEKDARADLHEDPTLDCGANATTKQLAAKSSPTAALAMHPQSQWAKPDSSGTSESSNKCFLNDADRLIRSFELAPADQSVKTASSEPASTVVMHMARLGLLEGNESNKSNVGGDLKNLKHQQSAGNESLLESENLVSSNNRQTNYNTKHSWKLCNDTCGGGGDAGRGAGEQESSDGNSTYGRVIELSAAGARTGTNSIGRSRALALSQMANRAIARVHPQSSSSASSSISPLIGLSSISRGATSQNNQLEEDACCGSSSCSSSGFGASVASTDGSDSQTAPTATAAPSSNQSSTAEPSADASATGVANNTAPKSVAPMSLANGSIASANLQAHPISAGNMQGSHSRRATTTSSDQYSAGPPHQSQSLTVAPVYDYLRPSCERKAAPMSSGGGLSVVDAQLNGVCKQRASLLDEFPDYKQLAVGPDEAYPKRSGRPLVVVENYGYASVQHQNQQHNVGQVNSSASVKEHSYANIPCAAQFSPTTELVWNNMDSSTGTSNNNSNGYAIVRSSNIKSHTSILNGSQMSFDQNSAESSTSSQPLPTSTSPSTPTTSSSESSSSSSSSSHSAGFSALPPVRLHGCTQANNFESLPPVLNPTASTSCKGSGGNMINSTATTNAATSCDSNSTSHKTKASLLKRFGSMVSRAFTNGSGNNSNNNGSQTAATTDNLEREQTSKPLPPTTTQSRTNGCASNGQQSDELKVEADACVATEQKKDACDVICESDLKDADLVILPPKSQIAPAKAQTGKQVANEQLSPRTRRRLESKSFRVGGGGGGGIIRVSRRQRRRARVDKEDSASLSSLCHSSESLCSSANAYHRQQIYNNRRDSTGNHNSSNDANAKPNQTKRYRKRASSLSEELESLMSRSAVDTDADRVGTKRKLHLSSKQNQFYGTTSAKHTKAALLIEAASLGHQKQHRDHIDTCYGIVTDAQRRNKSISSQRFDIDCGTRKGQQKSSMGVDGNVATNVVVTQNKNSSASLQVLKWFGRESNHNISGQCLPKIESTPELSKRASVLSHSGGLVAPSAGLTCNGDQAIDQRDLKSHQNRLLRGSKVAQARNLSATTDSICDRSTCDKAKDLQRQSNCGGYTSLIEQSHADTDCDNNTKLGRKCSSKQQEQKSQTKATKVALAKRLRSHVRQPTSLIYSNLLHAARKSTATKGTQSLSASSDEDSYGDDDERDSLLECDDEEADRCKLCVASLNQGADESENSINGGGSDCSKNKCDSPSLYQILLRNYAKRRHSTAATKANAAAANLASQTSAPGKTDERDARYCSLGSSSSRHHYHRSNHTTTVAAEKIGHHRHARTSAHRHTHRHHSHRHHRHHRSHHHHRHHHRHHHCCEDSRVHRVDAQVSCGHSFRSNGELLDTNELQIRGTGSATSARTPTTTTTTSGAESGADCCVSRQMQPASLTSGEKTAGSKGKRSVPGSCCSETVAAAAASNKCNNCNQRQAHVWGQLIKINRSDGTQVVELQRAPGKHWGFFVARGAINNVKGIFISRMHDNESSLNGLLSIGDRIIAIDENAIEPDHDIMRVNQMISKKSRILLKLKPLKG